jgi:hypothetical protein
MKRGGYLRRKSLKPRVGALGFVKKRSKNGTQAWIRAIPISQNHGSGILQKKLWRLVSDYVRIRDWYEYGTCVATGKRIEHWKDGQAGHFRPYSICRGIFKFDERNIFLQSARSNSWGGYDDWIVFEAEVTRRTGEDKDSMDRLNLAHELKLNDSMVIEKIRDILDLMEDLPEKPDYYARVRALSTDA